MDNVSNPPVLPVLRRIAFFILLLTATAYSNLSVSQGQFTGEDEPFQWVTTTKLIDAIRQMNFAEFNRLIEIQDHPPLRYILSIPGVLIWPHAEFGLRLMAILFSFVMTYQVYRLGQEIGGEAVGRWSSLFIAVSGVYNWTSMAFGWSVTVSCMILVIRFLRTRSLNLESRAGKKHYALSNLLIVVMFLINTGNLLLFFTFSLIALWNNRQRINLWLLQTLPAGLFYTLYYLYFFGFVSLINSPGQPIGQLAHTLQRTTVTYSGFGSLQANLMGINAYFFPYLSWIMLGFTLWALARNEKLVFAWVSLYIICWSFVLSGQTAQYFLLVYIATIPFGVKAISESVKPLHMRWGGGVLLCLLLAWNQILFIRHYDSDDPNYPSQYLQWGMAEITRQHNVYQPFTAIARDLKAVLKNGNKFVSDLNENFTIFYYRKDPVEVGDANFAGQLGSQDFPLNFDQTNLCFQPSWSSASASVIITTHIICPSNIAQTYSYPRSNIRIYTLK